MRRAIPLFTFGVAWLESHGQVLLTKIIDRLSHHERFSLNRCKMKMNYLADQARWFRLCPDLLFILLLFVFTGCGTVVYDISPNIDNGIVSSGASSSGLIVSLAGSASTLYAVTANAGVWRTPPSLGGPPDPERKDPAWAQLWKSPERAYCIAVDPSNSLHLVVGERDGDAGASANHSGVWESFDGGFTWPQSRYFDPRSQNGCSSQSVPAVAFSQKSTLLIATLCGIGVKTSQAATYTFPTLPAGVGPISALVASETKLWARDRNGALIVSTDDGTSWKLATTQPLPAGTSFPSPGDSSSLGAFDNWVFMSTLGENNGSGNNFSQLLIFDVQNSRWLVQKRIQNALNGTGAGGRRLVKSYVFQNQGLGNQGHIGEDLQLFFCTAQEVFRATSQNPDGTLTWINVAVTTGSGFPEPPQPQFANRLHSDIWDLLPTADGSAMWIATDGGVYQTKLGKPGWALRSSGLHTHHIHDLYYSQPDKGYLFEAYPTHDNNAWFLTKSGWDHESSLGDASWVAGDAAVPVAAVLARQTGKSPCTTMLTGFGQNLPSGTPLQCITLSNDPTFDGPLFFRFIQTPRNEPTAPSPLDAVMLAKLPLQFVDGNGNLVNVPGHLGNPDPNGTENLVLLRNKQFINHPDINTSQGTGWEIAANNLPTGTQGFWVAGGHTNPIFYVFAIQSGQTNLFKGIGPRPPAKSQWIQLNVQGNLLQPQPYPPSHMVVGGVHGPGFVNPYDASTLYILTTDGVRVSSDGGFSFSTDSALTGLITGGGQFPIVGAFPGRNGFNTDLANNYTSISMATLSDMAWSRFNPDDVVASSPFTGVFYSKAKGPWIDMTKYLPTPHTPISTVGINGGDIYVATEGRSLLMIRDP